MPKSSSEDDYYSFDDEAHDLDYYSRGNKSSIKLSGSNYRGDYPVKRKRRPIINYCALCAGKHGEAECDW